MALLCAAGQAAEQTDFSWPLGPIGGKMRLWQGEALVRVSELTADGPGAKAGLKVNDFIVGALGRPFDRLGNDFEGVVRQLGDAIEHAESNDGQLPLDILRSGVGRLTINVDLPELGPLGPLHPLTSAKHAATYEHACRELHARVMSDSDGDLKYPTGMIGLALLGHPNWNDTAGDKPYRLSINKIREWITRYIHSAELTPVETTYYDGTSNPHYIYTPWNNWHYGLSVMMLAEYITKTGELEQHQATLQRAAVMMANRVQNWAQPYIGGRADLRYGVTRGAVAHGGVTGDYAHASVVGFNMPGVHVLSALAMAKRAGADMTERPKDGHYFGHSILEGDTIPPQIAGALPSTIVLPRGAEDTTSGYAGLDNTTNAPLTTVHQPFYYDFSLDQKFWVLWEYLSRSTDKEGWVGYCATGGGPGDAGGRTPGAFAGMKIYHGNSPLDPADAILLDSHQKYITKAHDRHLNAHAYNIGATLFTALSLPWFTDQNQRYFWDNWKFREILMRQPDGTLEYFRGRPHGDAYQEPSLMALLTAALPRSVAMGGLPHVPGYDRNRIFVHFKTPLLEWPTPEARRRRLTGAMERFQIEVMDADGKALDPSLVRTSWSILSGPSTAGILSSTTGLETTTSFQQAGVYRLRLEAQAGSLTTVEHIDLEVLPSVPPPYVPGEADYRVYTGINGQNLASLTTAANYPELPNFTGTLTSLEGTHRGDQYGSVITTTIIPAETGIYRFYIASDDHSSLRFNAGGTSATEAVEIAAVNDWTEPREWNKFTSQQSVPISLTAGNQYYLQAIHKEGGGGDHLAIGWTTPSNPTITVIGSPFIARPPGESEPAILTQPKPVTTQLGGTTTLAFQTRVQGLALYQWRRNGIPFGVPQTTPNLNLSNISSRLAGSWDCVFTHGSTVLTTAPVTLAVEGIGVLATGGLWQEVFTGVRGGTVNALIAHPSYPLLSTSSGPLIEPRTSSFGDDYGQRWTGWLLPPTSGRYRFLVASDDESQLYLSPDEYESHKQLIHNVTGFTGEMDWKSRPPSAWIQLEAGKRYYVELLHAEGGGGDHAAFTWQREGDPMPANGSDLIPSAHLQHVVGGTEPDADRAPPLAVEDRVAVAKGGRILLDVVANDIDASPATLDIAAFTQPAHGTLRRAGRNLIYVPADGYLGKDGFTYTVRNRLSLSSTTSVEVTVTDPWQDMMAWWKLDDSTGTVAEDSSGNNRHLQLQGNKAWVTGQQGMALEFSDPSQTASTAEPGPVYPEFTLSAWIRPNDLTRVNTVFSFGNSAAFRTHGTRLRFTVHGLKNHDTSTGLLASGTWTHVAVSFRAATPGGAKFYVNGVLHQSVDTSSISTSTPGIWRVGASLTQEEWFKGLIDEVRLYNRVLNDSEIASIASPLSAFEKWRHQHHRPGELARHADSGPESDADGDGIPAILEYALGLKPTKTESLHSKVSHEIAPLAGGRYLRLRASKDPAASGVQLQAEASDDLQTWTTSETVIEQDDESVFVARDLVPQTAAPRRFLRLKASME